MKPILLVTGHAPRYRAGAFACLHDREGIEVALFGGAMQHGGASVEDELPFPHRRVRPHQLAALAGGGGYRAVCVPTGGRAALLATWGGARRAGVPLILWASLWAHPRTAAHALSYLPLLRLYRSADAVVTYGPHVSRYVVSHGARNVHVAPQSVDNGFWSAPATAAPSSPSWPAASASKLLFVGRPVREKGLAVLSEAWRRSGLQAPGATLVIVGEQANPHAEDRGDPGVPAGPAREESGTGQAGIVRLGPVGPQELRSVYAAADLLVIPSIATRTFREPWGLVANEAMNQGLAVIASDAVGAAAGGLVRDGRNGLVVPAGDSAALADALRRLSADEPLRARLGQTGRQDVSAYSHEAWADGFSAALATLGVSRRRS